METTFWLTRDSAGVNLWQSKPTWGLCSQLFYEGGETLTLSDDSFPALRMGECVPVHLAPVFQGEETCQTLAQSN